MTILDVLLGEATIQNFMQAIVTDTVRVNADFQYKAGLNPKIVRKASKGCCDWCKSLEGTYNYEDVYETGNDVWKRHTGCHCTVTYDPGTGKVQNVWDKSWRELGTEKKIEERKAVGIDTASAETLEARKTVGLDDDLADVVEDRETIGLDEVSADELELRKVFGLENNTAALGKNAPESVNGIADKIRKKQVTEELDEEAKETLPKAFEAAQNANPKYNSGEAGYKINCQRCVPTYELRRRGYDVTAKPRLTFPLDTVIGGDEIFGYSALDGYSLCQTKKQVFKELKKAPDGARYSIYMQWKDEGKGSHVFAAEKISGKTYFLDPQSGATDVSGYFSEGIPGMFGYLRMDDKVLTSDNSIINDIVEGWNKNDE